MAQGCMCGGTAESIFFRDTPTVFSGAHAECGGTRAPPVIRAADLANPVEAIDLTADDCSTMTK